MKSDCRIFQLISIILSLSITITACKKTHLPVDETMTVPAPVGLVLDKEIKGMILGQRLSGPLGITADNFGNIYFIDGGNNRLIKMDREFNAVRDAGGYGSSEGQLNDARYIDLDNNLNIYVSDASNRRISIFDARLNFVDQISLVDPDDPLKFGQPSGLMVSKYGELWVADPDKSRISLFNNFGGFERFVADAETYSGLILAPAAVVRGERDRVMVSDVERSQIFIFDSYGSLISDFGKDILSEPTGLAYDENGHIWVVDAAQSVVSCFNPAGKLIFSEGRFGYHNDYEYNRPHDLAVLPGGKIAVSDTGNNRILIYKVLYSQ